MKENEIIATFMGATIVARNGESAVYMFENAYCPEYFRCTHYDTYHTDWRELMPVVEKIESLGYTIMIAGNRSEVIVNEETESFIIFANNYENKLSATYQAVIQFINYYNQKK